MPVTNRTPQGFDPLRDVKRTQDFAREGVKSFGESLNRPLLKSIGDALGGLNEIGALRSGGTKVAFDDITERFGAITGRFASEATLGAIGQGLEAGRSRTSAAALQFEKDEARRKRKSGLFKAIGGIVGAGIGFATGGPAGAVAGGQAGSGGAARLPF